VGATAAVGLLEGRKGISWAVMSKAIAGWILTLIIVGLLSALLTSLGIYTPNLNASKALGTIQAAVGSAGEGAARQLATSCPNQVQKIQVRATSVD
jgi:hypothetical protein